MEISFRGYGAWKNIKDGLGIFHFYVFPTIAIHYDDTFKEEEYPTEIKISWLIWELSIYLKKHFGG